MSSTITLIDAQGIKKPEVIEYSGLLSDWILENLDNSVPATIYAGGLRSDYIIASSDSEISEEEFLRLNLHHEKVFIVSSPLGIDPISILAYVAIAAATAFVSAILMPKPELPEGTRQPKSSPNNSVGPQTNVSRPNDRVPDIFGEDRSTPDLITPGVFEFVDHIKFIEQDFCISRGYGQIDDVRSGETLGSEIVGFQLEVYEPGQAPSSLLKGRESNEVKTLTLNPPNDIGTLMNGSYFLDYDSSSQEGFILSRSDDWGQFGIGASVNLGDVFFSQVDNLDGSYISSTNISPSIDMSGMSFSVALGEMTITGDFSSLASASIAFFSGNSGTGLLDDSAYKILSSSASQVVIEYGGTLTSGSFVSGLCSGFILGLDDPTAENSNWSLVDASPVLTSAGGQVRSPRVFGADQAKERGPFTVPGDGNNEIWLDIQFPRGLVVDNDKSYTVTVRFLFEEIDSNDIPTGYSFTVDYSFTDSVIDPRFYTRKVNQTTVPAFIPQRRYRITGERISNTNVDDFSLSDQCQWTRLVGIENIATGSDSTGTTRIKVKTQATEQTSSLQQSQINLRWTRKCAYWNGSQVIGDVTTGVGLIASRRMADNFITYSLDPQLGARNESSIDFESIYEIQAELDAVFNGEKGEFGFTFSDANTPALEEMRQIANSCRCFIFRNGSIISMVRDEAQSLPKALFNRRNKIPFTERKSQKTNKPLDYDGIEFSYKSRTDDEQKTILLPDDLPTNDPNYPAPAATNYKVIQATGIRNLSQAWDRAQYEYNKLIYQREQVETTVDEEGILLNLNDRIEHSDGTRIYESRSDGEVLGFLGVKVDTSEECIFERGKTYSVFFRNDDGSVTPPIPATEREDTSFGFVLSSTQSLFLRGEFDYQIGSLYSLSSDDETVKSYLVQSITPNEVGEVSLELINYDQRYYQADSQIPPEGIE